MKIFSWVHRRFNNKAENVKKNGNIAAVDEQFPAENKCNVVFERWRGGILAIGTFGYDPLKDENQQLKNDYFLEEADDRSSVKDQRDDSGVDEGNPLVLVAYDFNAEELAETEENMNHEDSELQFGFEYVMMKKKERTTLADLFVADSDQDHRTIAENRTFKKPHKLREKSNRMHAPLFAGKLTAKDACPIHKLNKLMRRLLRRKIHPDVGPINPKSRAAADCASLLPSQDTNIDDSFMNGISETR